MRLVFADTYFWIALLHDKDQGHAAAQAASQTLQQDVIVTTQEVLSEVLTHVRPQSDRTFLDGLALYEARPDKGYSLTDCISMVTMRREGVTEVLTHDDHFAQEGFIKLL